VTPDHPSAPRTIAALGRPAATSRAAPATPAATLVQRDTTPVPAAGATAPSVLADAGGPDQHAAAGVRAHAEAPRLSRDPAPPRPDAAPVRAASPLGAASPPNATPPPSAISPPPAAPPGPDAPSATPPRVEALAQADLTAPPDPAERAHRALAEVRRWMEEPPPRARRAATASAATADPGVSIGTIEVTVEEAPAPRPVPAVAPPPPVPRRAGRDVVPRDYLRGW